MAHWILGAIGAWNQANCRRDAVIVRDEVRVSVVSRVNHGHNHAVPRRSLQMRGAGSNPDCHVVGNPQMKSRYGRRNWRWKPPQRLSGPLENDGFYAGDCFSRTRNSDCRWLAFSLDIEV